MPTADIYTYIPTTREQYAATFTVDPVLAAVVIGSLLLMALVLGIITIRRAWVRPPPPSGRRN